MRKLAAQSSNVSTAVILLAGMAWPALNGPWTQERGHGVLIAGRNHSQAGDRFFSRGAPEPLGPGALLRSLTPQLWLEAELTEMLTGVVAFSAPSQLDASPSCHASCAPPVDVQSGLWQAARKFDGGRQPAAQGLLKAPACSSPVEHRPGNGYADLEILFCAGRICPAGPCPGFFTSGDGCRGRSAGQWRGELARGLHTCRRLSLMEQLFLIRSAGAFPMHDRESPSRTEPSFHLARQQLSAFVLLSATRRHQSGYGWDPGGRGVDRRRQWIGAPWTSF